MELLISYTATFGQCDGSDSIEFGSVTLSDEEAKAAIAPALIGDYDSILELPELKKTYDRIYDYIEPDEISNLIDMDDDYTLELQGMLAMEPDEVNRLVHSKDANALEYFELQDATDEEIAAWDANDQEELPSIGELDPDFEPESPFNQGYSLNLFVSQVTISEEELAAYLKTLFANHALDKIKKIKCFCEVDFDFDLEDFILEVAKEVGCQEYIDSCPDTDEGS